MLRLIFFSKILYLLWLFNIFINMIISCLYHIDVYVYVVWKIIYKMTL